MALDQVLVDTYGTPEWWMTTLAKRLLDRDRIKRLGILDAYRSGCPPMVTATDSQRKAFQAFNRVSRSNLARTIVRAPGERMLVRSIRTAADNDDEGDEVAWRYWVANSLDTASVDVHQDMLSFSEGYVRVGQRPDGSPIALRRDPRFCIAVENPLNPLETLAAFELVWDEFTGYDYAYLWLPGQQWVASRERKARPSQTPIPGLSVSDRRWAGMSWWPRLAFDAGSFTMRPNVDDVDEADRDDRPYSQTYASHRVPVVRFDNRDGVGEYEEHLDKIDRVFMLTMLLLVTAGVQAYKQRSLQQVVPAGGGPVTNRLPQKNPDTGEVIDWDEVFAPGPDALWLLPPGVTIHESGQVDLQGLLSAIKDAYKEVSAETSTPFAIFSPDGVNQSAAGAEGHLEPLVFKVNDRNKMAARKWATVMSLLFEFAPDADRYADDDRTLDRANIGEIVIDFEPPVRYSILEQAQADAQSSLPRAQKFRLIYGMTPADVKIAIAQANQDALIGVVATRQGAARATADASSRTPVAS